MCLMNTPLKFQNFLFSPFNRLPMQGRRTSERFIKPAVPCLNTSAPNVMSSMSSGCSSNPMNIGAHNVTLPANINHSSIQFAANNALTQPASPMDTSVYTKD